MFSLAEIFHTEKKLDLWTIELRIEIQSLGEITGENVTESVLERIFNRFCIRHLHNTIKSQKML